jgi:CCR4-NOT transcription complex subunit 1
MGRAATQPQIFRHAETGSDSGVAPPKKEIKDAANSFFEQIYSEKISLDQCVARFRAMTASNNPADREVFDYMIHNLFVEYQYFHQYPEKELLITSNLVGILVLHNILPNDRLLELMQMVLNAVNKDPETSKNIHRFGVTALFRFKDRLQEWPNYATRLFQSAFFSSFPEELRAYIAGIIKSPRQPNPALVPASSAPPGVEASHAAMMRPNSTRDFSKTTTDSTPPDLPPPPSNIISAISIMMNNLSLDNVRDKAREFQTLVPAQFHHWFANYLVFQRASNEFNNQNIYIMFLDSMPDNDNMLNLVRKETFRNIDIHLRRFFISGASTKQDRDLMKNLGNWLGLLTLARNQPVLFRDLPLKELLIQAFELGANHLLTVVPFVAKVLDTGKQGLVFKPPNPWVVANLRLLRELSLVQGMKLPVVFEVEMLFKAFGVKLDDIKPSEILQEIPHGNSPSQPISISMDSRQNSVADESKQQSTSSLVPAESTPAPPRNYRLAFPNLNQSTASLTQYLVINPSIPFFQQYPHIRQLIQPSIEKALADATPAYNRALKIACVSTLRLIGKDFGTDVEESRIRFAALQMIQNIAGPYASISCRDVVRAFMLSNLGAAISQLIRQPVDSKVIHSLADAICNDNLDLACAFMERIVADRVVSEIDAYFAEELGDRRLYRQSGSTQFFASKLFKPPPIVPAALLPKVGGPDASQLAMYDRFFAFLSGAPQSTAQPQAASQAAAGDASQPKDEIIVKTNEDTLDRLFVELDRAVGRSTIFEFSGLPQQHEIFVFIREILTMLSQNATRTDNACRLAKKLFYAIMEVEDGRPTAKLLKDTYFVFLVQLQDTYRVIYQDLTREYNFINSPRKFDIELIVRFLRARLLEASELDLIFTRLLETLSPPVFIFVEGVLRGCLLVADRPQHLGIIEFSNSIDKLRKQATMIAPRESLASFLEALNALHQAALRDSQLARNTAVRAEEGDPSSLREIVAYFFEEWIRINSVSPRSEGAVLNFITKLMGQGLLKNEDISARFFRVCTDFAIQLSPTVASSSSMQTSYSGVESFARLIIALLKFLKETPKIMLVLTKVLTTLQAIVIRDHDLFGTGFNQKAYHRLFANLLSEVHLTVVTTDELTTSQLVGSFAQVFHNLRPSTLPGFCFAWLSLISHRNFMPALLQFKSTKGALIFQHLLASLFNFIGTQLHSPNPTDAVLSLYKGTLRVMLVLMHDFPELLCEYHFSLCDAIPPSCIQLRNLVLSAFPRSTQLPDPFSPTLKIDALPETSIAPIIQSPYTDVLQSSTLMNDLAVYISGKGSPVFLHSLPILLLNSATQSSGSKFNIRLINALVLHIGILTIERLSVDASNGAAPAMEIFTFLTDQLDPEGKGHVFNAIANQLRFPNSHTKYFSHVLLALFLDSNDDRVREQIARIMVERLIAYRPQPWGLLVTFIELIKNRQYKFWSFDFVRCGSNRFSFDHRHNVRRSGN